MSKPALRLLKEFSGRHRHSALIFSLSSRTASSRPIGLFVQRVAAIDLVKMVILEKRKSDVIEGTVPVLGTRLIAVSTADTVEPTNRGDFRVPTCLASATSLALF